ncbi:hypothetical protein, partial [Serratia marcescens]|uniref:hypothetical protein n=1 Tax=Serratia marcescens TaxID=615 RepID=UPI0019537D9F
LPQSSLNLLANRELPPHSWFDYSEKIVELAVVEPINFLDFIVSISFPVQNQTFSSHQPKMFIKRE